MACLGQGKHLGLAIVIVLIIRGLNQDNQEMVHVGINQNNNNRLSFDSSKTGGCKPARTVIEGCGSTEPVGGDLGVPTLKEAVPPASAHHLTNYPLDNYQKRSFYLAHDPL